MLCMSLAVIDWWQNFQKKVQGGWNVRRCHPSQFTSLTLGEHIFAWMTLKIHAYKLFIEKIRWLTEIFNISLKKCKNLRKYVSWKVEIWHTYQQ